MANGLFEKDFASFFVLTESYLSPAGGRGEGGGGFLIWGDRWIFRMTKS